MKRFFTFFVILVTLSFWFSVAEAQTVWIPDANLATLVRDELGLAPNAPITRQAMQRLTFLDAQSYRIREVTGQGGQIEDITGLEHATRLRRLWLNNNRIRDIRPLSRLIQLEELGIWNNQIRDITPLAGLKWLTRLNIFDNPINDLSPLTGLAVLHHLGVSVSRVSNLRRHVDLGQLESLWLDGSGNRIEDLRLLTHLMQLRRLEVVNAQVRDLSFLERLTQLESLSLRGNDISDLKPLAGLTQLESLRLSSNVISDLKPLADLTQLESLNLGGNEISDLKPLAGLTELKYLYLWDNQVRDVSPLAGLVNLESLYLNGNPVQDASPLASLTKLRYTDIDIPKPPPGATTRPISIGNVVIPDANLARAVRKALGLGPNAAISKQRLQSLTRLDARDSQVKNLTGLEHATGLRSLELRDNQISNIRPLANLKSLDELILDNNRVSDIRPLTNMKQLTWLLIGKNPISDFKPLTNLTELRGLSFWGNNISDVTLFTGLTKLTHLWLGLNKIRDITPLTDLVNLKVLSLHDNQIRDLSPLARLVNLETLHLKNNPIQDTSVLASLTILREIDIEITQPAVVVQVEASERPPMYWINVRSGTLHRLMGAEVENLAPNVRNATGLAIDATGGKLYWTEKTGDRTGRIRRANLDGTGVQLVKNLTSVPHSVALDTVNGKLYLTNAWGKIQRLNVDGSNFQPNFITDLDAPGGLALDVSDGKVYWTEASGRVRRADFNGSNIEDLPAGPGTPMNIAVSDSTVYWTVKTGEERGEIRFANLSGKPNVATYAEFNQGFPIGIAVDAVAEKLYWTTSRGKIGRGNIDESTFQPNFGTGFNAPGALVLSVEPPLVVGTPEAVTTDAVVSIVPSPVVSPAIGRQLTLNLNITGGEAVAGYQVILQFDPTALRYVESSNGDYLPAGAFFLQPVVNRDSVELAATALTGVSNGDGTLAVITFEVMTVKVSTLTLSETLLADSQGSTFLPQVEAGEITEPPELKGDVNSDGIVNIQDLVLVASSFGQTGQNPADINADGVVNIADLVLVAGALGTSAAAPLLYPDSLELLTSTDMKHWFTQAQNLDLTDATSQRGILMLQQLLAALIPKETSLLANYPNPFNPETWIPYQLSESAEVTLHIYSINGRLIRTLALGHQPAGMYQSKSRAAYWDGRNNAGERVASGVYFYTLTAGDFTATGKMLIKK